jgi:hypothetical protein
MIGVVVAGFFNGIATSRKVLRRWLTSVLGQGTNPLARECAARGLCRRDGSGNHLQELR